MTGILAQLSISPGGIPKTPIDAAHVWRDGVAGDAQRNRKYHGGPDRAICLYSEELYAWLREDGVDLANGAVGENFTTRGVDLQSLRKGDQLRVGETCVLEITNVRVPCRTLMKWSPDLPWMIEGRSGWVAKVVSEGAVRAGDPIELLKADAPVKHTRTKAGAT
ncbi:MAG: MOSC domain-containing protein [Tepidisphaeraceae bacterium]